MLAYYLKLALKSLRRNPVLSSLMVLALGLGIGACVTTLTVYYLMSGNPIPHKSEVLYAVQLDSWDPNDEPTEGAEDVRRASNDDPPRMLQRAHKSRNRSCPQRKQLLGGLPPSVFELEER